MKRLENLQIQLNSSEHRMLTSLCGYLAPKTSIVEIARLRTCIGEVNAEPPKHDMAEIAQDLLAGLLAEAEALIAGVRRG